MGFEIRSNNTQLVCKGNKLGRSLNDPFTSVKFKSINNKKGEGVNRICTKILRLSFSFFNSFV